MEEVCAVLPGLGARGGGGSLPRLGGEYILARPRLEVKSLSGRYQEGSSRKQRIKISSEQQFGF